MAQGHTRLAAVTLDDKYILEKGRVYLTGTQALVNGTNSIQVANTESILGGTGADTIVLTASLSGGTIDLGAGSDTLTLANAPNSIQVANIESILGGTGNDTIVLTTSFSGGTMSLGAGVNVGPVRFDLGAASISGTAHPGVRVGAGLSLWFGGVRGA